MKTSSKTSRGFTLVELILVMTILVMVTAIVAPNLRGFGAGRRVADAARQIVGLTQYAQAMAANDGRVYRLNFDTSRGEYWLTFQADDGQYQSPTNDYGQHFTIPDGTRLSINVTAQPLTNLLQTPAEDQTPQMGPPPVSTQNNLQPNQLMVALHAQGTSYVEFQPTGRLDPGQIILTDANNHQTEISSASATEGYHVLTAQEMTR